MWGKGGGLKQHGGFANYVLSVGFYGKNWWTTGGQGKTVPLQAWSGPEGSRKLRLPDFMTTGGGHGGKVVSLTHRPSLPPGNIPGFHFC